MNDDRRWEDATERLLRLTEDDAIRWVEDHSVRRSDLEGAAFVTTIKDRLIAAYEYKFQSYDPDLDTTTPATGVAIEFISNSGETKYRWPRTSWHAQLLDAIRYKTAKVAEFLDDFLK